MSDGGEGLLTALARLMQKNHKEGNPTGEKPAEAVVDHAVPEQAARERLVRPSRGLFSHRMCEACDKTYDISRYGELYDADCPMCKGPMRDYDSNAEDQNLVSVQARAKNHVVMSSNININDGSHMLAIINQTSHSAVALYKAIRSANSLSKEDRESLFNEVKNLEAMPARFASGLKGMRG